MSKLRMEHGASKINWVMLKTNIEESISTDIDRMCQWSNNERRYVVNKLLRFGLAQSEDFHRGKTCFARYRRYVAIVECALGITASA